MKIITCWPTYNRVGDKEYHGIAIKGGNPSSKRRFKLYSEQTLTEEQVKTMLHLLDSLHYDEKGNLKLPEK